MYECTGRIVISGIEIIRPYCKKISATLASTGTPSYFIHSTEASHGDLGMILENDICILISNSGETLGIKRYVKPPKKVWLFLLLQFRQILRVH